MALLPIIIAPDARLKVTCDPVEIVGADIVTLLDDMLGTMYAAPGLGLAAPQVDVQKRLLVVDVSRKRRISRFSLETKLVLVTSILLWVLGAGVLFLAEFNNSATMASFSWVDKVMGAIFSSVSGRTAGLTIMDFGEVKDVTKSTFSGLMFIGGAAGSVAGGIKVATFAVLMAAVISSLKGRPHAEAFGREIHQSQLHRALTVAVLGFAFILVSATVLTTL